MKLKSILETILFVYGEPISANKLAEITKKEKEEITASLEELKKDYKGSGLALVSKENEWQMGSAPENAKYVEKMMKGEFTEELSKSSLESLAIVAYKGPLTRIQLEHIRGVNSSFTLRNLLMRGLVERIENPKDARSFLYKISMDFLKHLGMTKMEDLPEFEQMQKEKIDIPQADTKTQ